MTSADILLAMLALGVAMLLARGNHPLVALLLAASALAVSAILFLPTGMLGDWLGMDRVERLDGVTRATPLELSDWVHLLAFAWLGLLVWLARKEVRNGWGVLLVAAFGVAAELSQWLTDGRQPKLEDAALNVVGGLAGVLLAYLFSMVAGRIQQGKTRAEAGKN